MYSMLDVLLVHPRLMGTVRGKTSLQGDGSSTLTKRVNRIDRAVITKKCKEIGLSNSS